MRGGTNNGNGGGCCFAVTGTPLTEKGIAAVDDLSDAILPAEELPETLGAGLGLALALGETGGNDDCEVLIGVLGAATERPANEADLGTLTSPPLDLSPEALRETLGAGLRLALGEAETGCSDTALKSGL